MEGELAAVDAKIVRAGDRRKVLDDDHADKCERQDAVTVTVGRLDDEGVTLTDAQSEHLDVVYAAVADPQSLIGLPDGIRRLRSRLAENSRSERDRAQRATNNLCGIFEQYQSREAWYDPNRGTGIEDYSAYRDELDQVDCDKAARVARLMFHLGYEVAQSPDRPQWTEAGREMLAELGQGSP